MDPDTGALRVLRRGQGDGSVLRSSALMDERLGTLRSAELISPVDYDDVMFLFSGHLRMTKDPSFTDNVLYWLLEDPR